MNVKMPFSISEEIASKINSFAASNFSNTNIFTPNGIGRQYCILNKTKTPISNLVADLQNHTYNALGISSFREEPVFGLFLGVNTTGGSVHMHKDPAPKGYHHVRLNFMVSLPEAGGLPVIEKKTIPVKEHEGWVNIASSWFHESTPVQGNKMRVVISLGALVPEEDRVIQHYLQQV